MWIGNYLVACLLLISLPLASASTVEEDTKEELILMSYEVSYCKFLTWLMYGDQLPPEVGLPWVLDVLEDVENKLSKLIEE